MSHKNRWKRTLTAFFGFFSKGFRQLKVHKFLAFVTVVILSFFAFGGLAYRSISVSDRFVKNGLRLHAVEALRPYSCLLVYSQSGCSALINAYALSDDMKSLEWISEACLVHHPDSYAPILGFAKVHERLGKEEEAISLLKRSIIKNSRIFDFHAALIQLLDSRQMIQGAVEAYFTAAQAFPERTQFTFEALAYISSKGDWKKALPLAKKIETAPTSDPAVKLILARVFMQNHDSESHQRAFAEAKALLDRAPELRFDLEKRFPDLFVSQEKLKN